MLAGLLAAPGAHADACRQALDRAQAEIGGEFRADERGTLVLSDAPDKPFAGQHFFRLTIDHSKRRQAPTAWDESHSYAEIPETENDAGHCELWVRGVRRSARRTATIRIDDTAEAEPSVNKRYEALKRAADLCLEAMR